jgi:hypothetical protein
MRLSRWNSVLPRPENLLLGEDAHSFLRHPQNDVDEVGAGSWLHLHHSFNWKSVSLAVVHLHYQTKEILQNK